MGKVQHIEAKFRMWIPFRSTNWGRKEIVCISLIMLGPTALAGRRSVGVNTKLQCSWTDRIHRRSTQKVAVSRSGKQETTGQQQDGGTSMSTGTESQVDMVVQLGGAEVQLNSFLTHWGRGHLNCLNALSRGLNNLNQLLYCVSSNIYNKFAN